MNDKTTLFDIEINGVKLTRSQMADIHDYYAACCTAERIMEDHDIESEDIALSLGYKVREVMDKYDMNESDAIEHVMSEQEN